MNHRSVVGDLINFRGLVYSPINENGVVFLFGKIAHDLNMYVEEIKPGFPDCVARRFNGKGWVQVFVEFEYVSSNFKFHGHDPKGCDLIICWEHDWNDCPVEVIALRDVIQNLENVPIQRPDEVGEDSSELSLEAFFGKIQEPVRSLALTTTDAIRGMSGDIWVQHNGRDLLTFYSPKRVFVYLRVQKKGLAPHVFTNGKPVVGVTPFGYEKGGAKWGRLRIRSLADVEAAKAALRRSLELINEAIANNENTGWFAWLDEAGNEDDEDDSTAQPAIAAIETTGEKPPS